MSRFPLTALLATLASTVALAIPTVAGAAIAELKVENGVLTVIADEADDNIILTVDGGVLVVNGDATTLAADANAVVIVEGGEGNDAVDASALTAADYLESTLGGGPGDDVVIGGDGFDDLIGDHGDDLLTGLGALDFVNGHEGDDLMVWNDGDGFDILEGDNGFDEFEFNGSAAAHDEITYTRHPFSPGAVLVDLEGSDESGADVEADRLTINGRGGPDLIRPDNELLTVSGRTSLVLNGGADGDELIGDKGGDLIFGGSGKDEIFSRDGSDTLNGGDGDDTMGGEEGDDRLLGDRGADSVNGNAGDDVLIWNNGDGSDRNEGAAGFDRVEFNGSPGEETGDALSLTNENGVTKLRRTNLVPVTVELSHLVAGAEPHGGVEALSVDGLAGADTFIVGGGLGGLRVTAQGGTGDDILTGNEEEDSFLGGPGADTIDPGAGSDLADGQEGDDTLSSRDGFGDLVRGGAGTDSAQADAANVDAVDGVEDLDAPPVDDPPVDDPPVDPPVPDKPEPPVQAPAGDTRALLPQLEKVVLTPGFGSPFARVLLSCPAAEAGGCATTLTLQTAAAVRLGEVRAPLVLGSKGASLGAGQRKTVRIRLAPGAGELARAGYLRVRLRLDSSDAAGNSAATAAVFRLRVPAPLRERP